MGTDEDPYLVCYGCEDEIYSGDDAVTLRLVYMATLHGTPVIYDAVDGDTGACTQEPVLFCYDCWSGYTDDLHASVADVLVARSPTQGVPSPFSCTYCSHVFGWGDWCCWATYGQLQPAKRSNTLTFQPVPNETLEHAELVCLECLALLNDTQGESIWDDLFTQDEEDPHDTEG